MKNILLKLNNCESSLYKGLFDSKEFGKEKQNIFKIYGGNGFCLIENEIGNTILDANDIEYYFEFDVDLKNRIVEISREPLSKKNNPDILHQVFAILKDRNSVSVDKIISDENYITVLSYFKEQYFHLIKRVINTQKKEADKKKLIKKYLPKIKKNKQLQFKVFSLCKKFSNGEVFEVIDLTNINDLILNRIFRRKNLKPYFKKYLNSLNNEIEPLQKIYSVVRNMSSYCFFDSDRSKIYEYENILRSRIRYAENDHLNNDENLFDIYM